ncbi:MAG: EamA family transporter, partial [archaeon]|nr:EamA family transporter [archaeon]
LTAHILFVKKLKLGIETVKKAPSILFFAGFFEALSFYIQLFALKMIDVSLYVPIRRSYSVVVILIACFFLKEKNIKNKILGAFLMILGVIVLTI